jgi:hypothetical protein
VFGDPTWRDYTFRGRFKFDTGTKAAVGIMVRVQEVAIGTNQGRYLLLVNDPESGKVTLQQVDSHTTDLEEVSREFDLDRWYEFEIEIEQSHLRYYLDGSQVLYSREHMEYRTGRTGLLVRDGSARFDDLEIYRLESEVPQKSMVRDRPLEKPEH